MIAHQSAKVQSQTQYMEKKQNLSQTMQGAIMKNYLYVISLESVMRAKFFLLNCKMVCALTDTLHCEKFCVFSHNNFCNPAENLRNTYSASVSQMPPIAINMKLRSIFLRDKFYRYLRTECGTYNLHEVQTHVFYVKS